MAKGQNNKSVSDILNKLKGWILCNQCGIKHSPTRTNYVKCIWAAFNKIDLDNNVNIYSVQIDYKNLLARISIDIDFDISEREHFIFTRPECKRDLDQWKNFCGADLITVKIRDLLESPNPTSTALTYINEHPTLKNSIKTSKEICSSISPGRRWWATPLDELNSKMVETHPALSLYKSINPLSHPHIIAAKWDDTIYPTKLMISLNGDYVIASQSSVTKISESEAQRIRTEWNLHNESIANHESG